MGLPPLEAKITLAQSLKCKRGTIMSKLFHITSSPPCWWTKTKDLLLAPFVCPSAIVHCISYLCL